MAAATRQLVLLTLAGTGLVALGLSLVIGRGIARPIVAVTRSMEKLAAGDLHAALPVDERRDEIGTMMRAVKAFRDSLVDGMRLRDLQAGEREHAATDKQAALVKMAEQIELSASISVQQIGERTTAMMAIAEEMGNLAWRTGNSAREASGAAALALGTAQMVASASDELAGSIREISGQVSHSASVVSQAVQAGQDTRAKIEALNARVGLIGAVVELKLAMMRSIRNSSEDVDRRHSPRHEVDLPCWVELAGQEKQSGRIDNISEGGGEAVGTERRDRRGAWHAEVGGDRGGFGVSCGAGEPRHGERCV
jgi:methyl-accepting chemotaxis protein